MRNYFLSMLVLACVVMTACGIGRGKGSNNSSAKLYNVTWHLVELEGAAVKGGDYVKIPSITFDAAEKRYYAVTDCNGISGTIKTGAGKKLTFSKSMVTMMACTSMEIERGFGRIFPLVVRYEITNERLELKDKESKTLATFIAMPK